MNEKTILLTGATGLIGKEAIAPLLDLGYKIHALTIDNATDSRVTWHKVNLFDSIAVEHAIEVIRPSHLLNFAWATTGDYLTNPVNYKFLAAGLSLISAFAKYGGKRAIFVGTCFEYKFKESPLSETDELEYDKFTYTFCKHTLHQIVQRFATEIGISFGYGRIFFVFGRNEDKRRLAGSLYDKLKRNERITITGGKLERDYMYAKDIAAAFATFIDSNVQGVVNIGTGKSTTIEDFAAQFAQKLGKMDLLDFNPQYGHQPPKIVANNTRLITEVKYSPSFSLDDALSDLLLQQ